MDRIDPKAQAVADALEAYAPGSFLDFVRFNGKIRIELDISYHLAGKLEAALTGGVSRTEGKSKADAVNPRFGSE